MSKVDRLRVQIAYGQAMMSARGHTVLETTEVFAAARELAAGIEEPIERYSAYYGLWVGSYLRGESASMREFAKIFFEAIARHPQGSAEFCLAHRICGVTCWWDGDYAAAQSHFEQAVAAYNFDRDRGLALRFGQDNGVSALTYLAMVHFETGETLVAREVIERAMELALRTEHIPTVVWAHFHRCLFEAGRGDVPRAKHHSNLLIAIATEHKLPHWIGYGTFFHGWCGWESQESEAALVEMQAGIDLLCNLGVLAFVPFLRALQARSEARAGNVSRSLSILDNVMAEIQRTGERRQENQIQRYRAEVLALEAGAHEDLRAAADRL